MPLVVTAVNGTALPFDVDGLPVPVALAPSGASLTMDSTGVFTYNPTLAYNSLNAGEQAADSFTYTVADTTGLTSVATVTVGITGVDDPPFAGPDSFTTTEDLAFTTTDVTLNDGDPDSADTISLTGPVHGLAGFPSGAGAKLVNNNDGTFDYDPGSVFQYLAAGETASDAFEYEITSSNAGTASGAVSVTVTGVNDAPTAQAQVLSTSGSPITILLKGADVDTSDDLDFSVDAAGTLGTLGTPDNNDGTCTPVGACVAPDKNTATVSYTPPAPANPGDPDPTTSFTFTVTDDAGATATATVTLNPPPEGTTPPADPLGIDAKDRIVEVTAGTTTSILMVASAPIAPQQGAIGNLTFTVNGSGTSGTLGTPIDIVPLSGPVRSARVGYNPGTFTGTTSFTFTACEAVSPPAQPTNCDTGTVTLQVGLTAATRPPQATDQAVVTPINTPVDINLATISTGGGTPPICDPGSGCGRAAPSAAPSIQADTFDDQSEFLAQLDTSTTFNFEQPTFPASPNVIGSVGGVNFTGRIGFFATAAPEGQQFMRGTNVGPPFTGPSVVDFSGLGELPNAIGFFAEEGANAPATSLEVTISFNDDTSVTQTVGGLSGTPAYFGFVEKGKRIESVTFQGKAGAADSEFLVDLLTYGVAGTVSVFADVAGEVSDIDSDGLGDGENELLPGGTAPLVISAGVDVNPHCGTTGRPACGLNPNEASFESGLTVSTQYDFETGSGFPAAGGTIGLFGGINFAAQTANFTSPPSGTQAMTGAGGTFTTATLDFTGLERRPIAIGFIALDLTQVGQEVIEVKITLSDNTVQTHDVQLAPSDPAFTPKHFGFVAPQFRTIKQVELRGTEAASRTTNRAWLIDDFVAGFDTGNAAVSTTSGIVRTQIEFDIDSLGLTPGEVESATVTLTTDKGSIDSLDTLFYVAAVDGDGDLSPSDFQTPAIQLDGVVMEVTPGVSTFSIDVADELRTALEAGFDYLVIQARVNEQLATGGSIQRGLQFRSTAAANLGNGTAPKLEVGVGDGPVAAIQQFAITSLPANGTLLIGGTPVTALPAVAPLAQVTFQPATGFTGVTSFNFQVTNVSSGLFDSGKVWVNVGSVLGTGLTVNIDFLGAGTGSVLTTGGTLCATDCTVQFLGGAAIMLEARPDSSGGFGGYGGDCSGTGQLFTLPAASGVKNCTVTFNP